VESQELTILALRSSVATTSATIITRNKEYLEQTKLWNRLNKKNERSS